MRASIGIPQDSYSIDRHGQRVSHSPMRHYPDYCPHFPSATIGDCQQKCSSLMAHDRPCAKAAAKQLATV
ncbi:MAG: hypothetical protein ABIH03_02315 [Pseudomonadota bacterium]